jgi:hypothetical protein
MPTPRPSTPSIALCPLYGSPSSRPSVYSTDLCPLFSTLSPLRPYVPSAASVPSTALCPFYGSLSPLPPSILYMALCFLNSPLYSIRPLSPLQPSAPLHPYVPSTALSTLLCTFHSPLSPPLPDTLSPLKPMSSYGLLRHVRPLIPSYSPLFPLRPFFPSTYAVWPLYLVHLSTAQPSLTGKFWKLVAK